jgi:hypothetical protein
MTIKRMLAFSLLAAAAALPAHAGGGDAVQFGTDINVARNTSVQDAVCFFCSVHVEGEVTGDVVVFFGTVHLAGEARHDVVNIFGSIKAADNTSIGDDLVSIFGSVRLGENVSVGKDLVAIFGSLHAASTVSVGGDRVVQPSWIFWGPLVFFIVVLVVLVRELRAYRRRRLLRGYPFPPRP